MQRYFVDKLNNLIEGDDYHHITKVMRMKKGDSIIICCDNVCYDAKIVQIDNKVTYELIIKHEKIDFPHITLIQGLPKYFKIDTVIKYATTFGASEIKFLQMNRSTSKITNIEAKLDRFNKIAKEACELAHKQNLTQVTLEKRMTNIDFDQFDICFVADEEIKDIENKLSNLTITKDLKIAVIIGPEGGISEEERIFLQKKKVVFVSLGNYVLPTEIANLYLLAIISAKYNNFFDKC